MYLSKLSILFVHPALHHPRPVPGLINHQNPWGLFVQISKCICSNCQMYLSKLPILFVQISKCICPNCKIYLSQFQYILSKLQNVFVQIAKYFCLNFQYYLSTLLHHHCNINWLKRGLCSLAGAPDKIKH